MNDEVKTSGGVFNSSFRVPRSSFQIQQAFVFFFDYPITLTRGGFESAPVENMNMPARVAYQSGILQTSGGNRDAFAPHAEQMRNCFLREQNLVGFTRFLSM